MKYALLFCFTLLFSTGKAQLFCSALNSIDHETVTDMVETNDRYVFLGSFTDSVDYSRHAARPVLYSVNKTGTQVQRHELHFTDTLLYLRNIYAVNNGFLLLGYGCDKYGAFDGATDVRLVSVHLDLQFRVTDFSWTSIDSLWFFPDLYFKSHRHAEGFYGIVYPGDLGVVKSYYFTTDPDGRHMRVVLADTGDKVTDLVRHEQGYLGFLERTEGVLECGYQYLDTGFAKLGFESLAMLTNDNSLPLKGAYSAMSINAQQFYAGVIEDTSDIMPRHNPTFFSLKKINASDATVLAAIDLVPDTMHHIYFDSPISKKQYAYRSFDINDDHIYVALSLSYGQIDHTNRTSLFVSHCDSNMKERWRTMMTPASGQFWTHVESVHATADGGCMVILSGQTYYTFSFESDDVFLVKLDAAGTVTGISRLSDARTNDMHLYPNPAKDVIVMDGGNEKITVSDLAGNVQLTAAPIQGKVDVSVLLPGIYVVQQGSRYSKFVKE